MRARLRFLALALLAAPALGDGAASPPHAAVRQELSSHCERLRTGDNVYFGTAILEDLRHDLDLARAARRPDIATRAAGFLGNHLIRVGRLDEAIELLTGAKQLAELRFPDQHALQRKLAMLLATAHLQRAEDQNCVDHHTARSCILPIDPSAVHGLTADGRQALRLYSELARRHRDDVQIRWLLNIAAMLVGAWPDAVDDAMRLPREALSGDPTWQRPWHDIAPRLGVDAFDLGGGAVADDFDGDGLLDIVTSTWDPCAPMKAWRNDGKGGFTDTASAWHLDSQLGGFNLLQADIDNDGDLDLVVLRGGWLGVDGRMRNSLLRNDLAAGGGFVDITAAAGLAHPAYPTQAGSFADYDLDGDLDLYIGNETANTNDNPLSFATEPGDAYPSQLFRNDGPDARGVVRFTDVAGSAGVRNDGFAKAVAWGDADNDGDPDLYVSNIGRNRLYRNDGPGADGQVRFTDVAASAGVTEPASLSFGTWFFDADHDGDLDLFVADYHSQRDAVFAGYFGVPTPTGHPILYRNDSQGALRFTDVSSAWGLAQPMLPMGVNYGDLDNDGWLDIYLGTGTPQFDAIMPNVMLRNDAGRGFRDITMGGGFGHLQKGHGIAFADLDNDGDQDVYQQMGGAFPFDAYGNVLYENPGNDHAWITLRLRGESANRFGIGARVAVTVEGADGGTATFHSVVGSGGSFGASSLQLELGLGPIRTIRSVVVRWPGGGTDRHAGVAPSSVYLVSEGGGIERVELPRLRLGDAR